MSFPELSRAMTDFKVSVTVLAGRPGVKGYADGKAADALFDDPRGIAIDGKGMLSIADRGNNRIRRLDPKTGAVTTLCGTGTRGSKDGSLAEANLSWPVALRFDRHDTLWFADTGILRAPSLRCWAVSVVPLVVRCVSLSHSLTQGTTTCEEFAMVWSARCPQ